MADISVSSSWTCNNLISCFTLGSKESPSLMDDIVQADKCVYLTSDKDPSSNPCTIDIGTVRNASIAFKMVHVVSQCRLIELFGYNGEYIHTFHGELFDEFDGTAVYVTKIVLSIPLSNISLKFTRLKENEVWIYGIYITKVIIKTKEQGLQKSLIQSIGKTAVLSNPSSQLPDFNHLKGLIESKHLGQQDLPLLLAKFLGGTSTPEGNKFKNDSSNRKEDISLPGTIEKANNVDLKKFFTEELQRIENKVYHHVNSKFDILEKKQTEFLDHVNTKFELVQKKQDLILNKIDLLLTRGQPSGNVSLLNGCVTSFKSGDNLLTEEGENTNSMSKS